MKLIDKAAVVADIEKRYNECLKRAKIIDAEYWNGKADAYRDMLVALDTLEVKEVNLDKEIDKFYGMYRKDGQTFSLEDNEECVDWKVDCNPEFEKSFAKHFFELGLKAKAKNIWHGANKEEPKIGKAFATIDSKWVMCAEYHVFEGGLTFKQMKEMDEIVKWAYTDDLIPKD